MKGVLCLGEALIDFTSAGESACGTPLFEQNAGGAPANVACALARLGVRAYMCGRVGADMFGLYLQQVLESEGVNIEFLRQDSRAPTTLAFVALDRKGERSFSFVRSPGADTLLHPEDISLAHLQLASVLHFGTLSLTHEPSRSAVMHAVKLARNNGVRTSIDINLRLRLWASEEEAHARIHEILPWCDLVKMSWEELCFTVQPNGQSFSYDQELLLSLGAELFSKYDLKLLCVTCGADGSIALVRAEDGSILKAEGFAYQVNVVDTTGAGDAFTAGMLYQLLKIKSLNDFTCADKLKEALQFANACAALCVTKRGAIAAMPHLREAAELKNGGR